MIQIKAAHPGLNYRFFRPHLPDLLYRLQAFNYVIPPGSACCGKPTIVIYLTLVLSLSGFQGLLLFLFLIILSCVAKESPKFAYYYQGTGYYY